MVSTIAVLLRVARVGLIVSCYVIRYCLATAWLFGCLYALRFGGLVVLVWWVSFVICSFVWFDCCLCCFRLGFCLVST